MALDIEVRGVDPDDPNNNNVTTTKSVRLRKVEVRPESGLTKFSTVDEAVKVLCPNQPLRCLHLASVQKMASLFVKTFPGKIFYAVKVNPDATILQQIAAGGVKNFDVASLAEIKLVHALFPKARLAYMNPIKSREAIRAAYFEYGVRDFSIDTFEELHKIIEETSQAGEAAATDLVIHVRLAMPKGSAKHELSAKFGAEPAAAAELLRDADKVAAKVGLCFHVGSQTMDPASYSTGIALAGEVIRASGVELDVLDIGGGFPVAYPGANPPPLSDFFTAITKGIKRLKLPRSCEIWGEPGRALATPAETLVLRVELRKGDALYVNDGGYGSLFDGMLLGQRWPAQLIRGRRRAASKSKSTIGYRFYGPTCDSMDYLPGPFMLPDDVQEGDWIALGQQGAYSAAMRTNFNGFYSDNKVEISETFSGQGGEA